MSSSLRLKTILPLKHKDGKHSVEREMSMRRKVIVLPLIPLLILISSCGYQPGSEYAPATADKGSGGASSGTAIDFVPDNSWTVADGITLRLLQDCYPPGTVTMTMILENRSDSIMMYGRGWHYEKYFDGDWRMVETIENYAFTLEGYTLYNRDKNAFTIDAGFLMEPLSEGCYRVTGCSLRVARDGQNLSWGGDYVEYPPYQLEFVVSANATAEPPGIETVNTYSATGIDPGDTQVVPLSEWTLPEIENWQWYTPWAFLPLYYSAGMEVPFFTSGNNGLVAIIYRMASEIDLHSYSVFDELFLLDIVDRKTGKRYEVLTEPSIKYPPSYEIWQYRDGFKIILDGVLFFCFIDDDDSVEIVPFDVYSGNTGNSGIDSAAFGNFSDEEIGAAIEAVNEYFAGDMFSGCELVQTWYDEVRSNMIVEAHVASGLSHVRASSSNYIALISELKVGPSGGGHLQLRPNSINPDLKWVLVRDSENSPWRVDDWGY